ncbi:MAG: glycoside hydrolase family 95 protein, partial [Prevotella sp.]|nr:glycoside hydrolase family 95 protein [Prevotella sp.]
DGNFGATAAIAEMFVQSQLQNRDGSFESYLLPSLPSAMQSGFVKGICARGGFIIDLSWEKGVLKEAQILSTVGGTLNLRTDKNNASFNTKKGQIIKVNGSLRPIK